MKLKLSKIYKINYIDKYGISYKFIGQYMGPINNKKGEIKCDITNSFKYKKLYQFNYYSSNDCTSCKEFFINNYAIKKCSIEEVTFKYMINYNNIEDD